MVFTTLLYASLIIFALGLIYKSFTWFSHKIGPVARDVSTSGRISAAAKGIFRVVFSAKLLILIRVFLRDVVLQQQILKEDVLRWLMHLLIYTGFMLLLLMHALENFVSEPLFSDYYSTINPFMFLRDLFGFMVIVGIAIAIYRRFILKVPRLKSNAMDYYAIGILSVILLSGVFLEGVKITSHTEFQDMVEEYSFLEDEDEIKALESYWVQHFGTVSPNVQPPFNEDVLSTGHDLHEGYCMDCHSAPQWAFTGYTTAKIVKPIALALDRTGAGTLLWYVHFIACFIGLAYLPFSKMFHIIATPVSLLTNAVMEKDTSDPANIATRQVMELDACMHCGTCSLMCSAASAFDVRRNDYILPSEKMQALKTLTAGKTLSPRKLTAIQEGVYLCTNCDRCTVVCPAGINLRELWVNVREDLIQRGYPEPLALSPFSFYRGLNRETISPLEYDRPLTHTKEAVAGELGQIMDPVAPISFKDREPVELNQLPGSGTFSFCFGCQTCTTVCPVVAEYENPQQTLGLLPHQIMNCLGLGLLDMATRPRMLWDCVTCYQCQENCPQNVEVTDILFQLKNIAANNVKKATEKDSADREAG